MEGIVDDDMTKLTLSVRRSSAEHGKQYAQQRGRSLSSMVNEYLRQLQGADGEGTLSANVQRLVGIGRGEANERAYRDHLMDKYA